MPKRVLRPDRLQRTLFECVGEVPVKKGKQPNESVEAVLSRENSAAEVGAGSSGTQHSVELEEDLVYGEEGFQDRSEEPYEESQGDVRERSEEPDKDSEEDVSERSGESE